MRYESRVCDACGRTSGPATVVREAGRVGLGLTPILTMDQRGWGLVDDRDLCPDCMLMHDWPGQLSLVDDAA